VSAPIRVSRRRGSRRRQDLRKKRKLGQEANILLPIRDDYTDLALSARAWFIVESMPDGIWVSCTGRISSFNGLTLLH
uniref:Uncharacterized protein n=1 Tax=Aegilops tauschii subsp. strangulata TaxID=200361 RepID=A0A453NRS5_AEGTS